MSDRTRAGLCALALLAMLCTSCWIPPRSYGLTEEGLRPVPALPRWAGPLPYSSRQASESAPQAPTVHLPDPLTLQDAFLLALKANKDILVSDLGAQADKAAIMGTEGQFDTTAFATISGGRTLAPVNAIPLSLTDQSQTFTQVGLSQRAITGTNLALTAANSYVRDRTGALAVNPAYSPSVNVSVSQDLLKNAGVSVNRTFVSVAENQAEISREALRNTAMNTLFEVESDYWSLYFALADLDVRNQQRAQAQRLVAVAQAQVNAGISAPLEVVRAKSSAAAQEVSILEAQNTISQLRRRLMKAMGIISPDLINPDFALADKPPEELHAVTLHEAVEAALESRPDYLQALLQVDSQGLLMHYFSNQRLPTLQLFGSYLLTGLNNTFGSAADQIEDSRFDTWAVGLQLSFPIPNRTARSAYQVARLQHQQALWQWRSVYEGVVRDVGDALSDLHTAEVRITTAEQSRQLAEEVEKAEEKSFSLGRSDSLDVLTAQNNLATAQRDEASARADYATSLANLYKVEGTLLRKKGVMVSGEEAAPPKREAMP